MIKSNYSDYMYPKRQKLSPSLLENAYKMYGNLAANINGRSLFYKALDSKNNERVIPISVVN